ncbi:cache domain-containing protein, partial [Frateuria sp. Soil773]|uniref:methyl-accepting chemotaxis protein n=1 Tax=Frateuria sp. Soil773 TaxID=1736407 RepID=UPI002E15EE7B
MDARVHSLADEVATAAAIAQSYHDRAQAGEFSDAVAKQRALEAMRAMRWNGGSGYVFAFDSGLVMRMHPMLADKEGKSIRDDTDKNGKPLYQAMLAADRAAGSGVTEYVWAMPPNGKLEPKVSYTQWFKPWDLHIGAGAYYVDIDAQFHRMLGGSLLRAALVALLVIAVVWLSMRSIRKSIGGEPAFAVAMVGRMADGDLALDGADNLVLQPGSMMHAMQRLHLKLVEVVREVQRGSQVVSGTAQQLSRGNDDLSQRTQEQASSLEETAASMEEMTATVRQSADNAGHANQLARGAREQAERGSEVAERASGAMQAIEAASRQITDIVQLIDEIAFQTNLLSLNAAVEAA